MGKRDMPARDKDQPAEDRPHLQPGQAYLSGEKTSAPRPLSSRRMLTEDECQAALVAHPEVHPGWKYFFARTRELADELRRKEAAKAASENREDAP